MQGKGVSTKAVKSFLALVSGENSRQIQQIELNWGHQFSFLQVVNNSSLLQVPFLNPTEKFLNFSEACKLGIKTCAKKDFFFVAQ